MNETTSKTVIIYQNEYGNEPYSDWVKELKDMKARLRILNRVERIAEFGAYGDCEPVGEGILELRIFIGAGYRVYFGEDGDKIVVLLCGGDKKTQSKDIDKAKGYWRSYNERKNKI